MDRMAVNLASWEWAGNLAQREKRFSDYPMIKMWADDKAESLRLTEKHLTPQKVDAFLNSERVKDFMS